MNKIYLITGATGVIGKHLAQKLVERGDEVIAETRDINSAKKKLPFVNKFINIDNISSLESEKIDGIINLAGMNLGAKRWNGKVKKEIYNSRIGITSKLVNLIERMAAKPSVLVNASGVDYYGDTGSKDIYEDSPRGEGFLSSVVKDWEDEARKAEKSGVRVVCLRTGLVFASDSENIKKMIMPYKLFVGGSVGTGKQFVSWIHIEDILNMYMFTLDNDKVTGAVNAASPYPVTMKELSKEIGKTLNRPSFFKVPGFIVRVLFGEAARLILNGRRALPDKIKSRGFKFQYERIDEALLEVLK